MAPAPGWHPPRGSRAGSRAPPGAWRGWVIHATGLSSQAATCCQACVIGSGRSKIRGLVTRRKSAIRADQETRRAESRSGDPRAKRALVDAARTRSRGHGREIGVQEDHREASPIWQHEGDQFPRPARGRAGETFGSENPRPGWHAAVCACTVL
jgi:hypothetical protein